MNLVANLVASLLLKVQSCELEILSVVSHTYKTITKKLRIVKLYSSLVITVDHKRFVYKQKRQKRILKSRLIFTKTKHFTGNYKIINSLNAKFLCQSLKTINYPHFSICMTVHFKRSLIRKNPLTLKPSEAPIQRCSIKSMF